MDDVEIFARADAFITDLRTVTSERELAALLGEAAREIGFQYYALAHHAVLGAAPDPPIRLHNYPDEWVEYYECSGLAVTDPVHRASQVTSIGFRWSALPELIALTPRDREILAMGAERGIGDGFTVPAHVPGESNGSCSFANPAAADMSDTKVSAAQLLGPFAFEAARQLRRMRSPSPRPRPSLTDRQRDCVIWVGRGKTAWETGRILGIKEDTVVAHLQRAGERLDAVNRMTVVVSALYAGVISFADVVTPG